jgi:hypothetical protein
MPDAQSRPRPDAASWFWPAGGGILTRPGTRAARLTLFYTRLARRGGDAAGTVWDFNPVGTTVAIVHNPSDEPRAWRVNTFDLGPIEQAGRRIAWGVAAARETSSRVFVLGVDGTETLNKKLVLARVESDRIGDRRHWQFWTGRDWSRRRTDATPVCDHVADELSIHKQGRHWVMVYMEPNLGRRIMVRTARALSGPWTGPRIIYECPEPAIDKHQIVYAARAHPELAGSSSRDLLVSYAVNSTDFALMLADAGIYRLRFLRVPRSRLRAP